MGVVLVIGGSALSGMLIAALAIAQMPDKVAEPKHEYHSYTSTAVCDSWSFPDLPRLPPDYGYAPGTLGIASAPHWVANARQQERSS